MVTFRKLTRIVIRTCDCQRYNMHSIIHIRAKWKSTEGSTVLIISLQKEFPGPSNKYPPCWCDHPMDIDFFPFSFPFYSTKDRFYKTFFVCKDQFTQVKTSALMLALLALATCVGVIQNSNQRRLTEREGSVQLISSLR